MKEEKDIQPIDKLFHQSLKGYTPAPPASVWKNIRSRLGNGGSSFVRFFTENIGLFVGSTVLLSIVGILAYTMYFSKLSDSAAGIQPATSEQNPSVLSQTGSVTKPDPGTFKTSNEAEIISDQSIDKEKKSLVSENQVTKTNTDNKSATTGFTSKSGHQITVKQSIKSENKVKADPISLAAGIEETGNPVPNTSNLNVSNSGIIAQEQIREIVSPDEKSLTVLAVTSASSESSPEAEKVSAEPVLTGIEETEKSNAKPDISPVTENEKPLLAPPAVNSSTSTNPLPADGSEAVSEKAYSYYIGVSGSYGQEILKGFNNSNFYSGSAMAGITHKKSYFSFETGIGFIYYNDQGIYKFDFRQTDTIGYTGTKLYNSQDSTYLFVFKPTTSDSLFSLNTTTRSSYSCITIPFSFSKQIFRSGKFRTGIRTGPSVEFLITRKETQPEYLLTGSTLIQSTNKSYSRVSTNWQWLIAPQFSWDITDKILFRVEPAAVFYLKNPYEPQNRPPAKPYKLSITGGLILKFD